MPKTETAAEKKAREQHEAEVEARELEERSLYEEYGLDYDNEAHRQSVAVRRLAHRLDKEDEERKKGGKRGGGDDDGPTSIF